MTGKPFVGILLALIVECAHWTRFRWDFNEEACGRAWQLSSIAIAIAGVLIYLDGIPRLTMSTLLTWMPPLLLPMQFIQSYGLKDSMPLNTFSFLAKQRRKRNVRLGLTESVVHLNFGNVYFVTALIGSTLGNQSSGPYAWMFLPGIIVLTGWMLLSSSRSRPISLIIALMVAGGIAVAGQKALEELEDRMGNSGATRSGFDPNSVSTLIGKPGTVEQSADIVWRLKPTGKNPPPRLLRTGNYNTYREDGRWVCQPFPELEFRDLDTRLQDGVPYYILAGGASEPEQIRAVGGNLQQFTLRGSAFAETPLALPGSTASLRDFELDGIERNSFGILRTWFQQNFRYSRTLKIRISPYLSATPTAIEQFLTTSRSGHCEYFAAATVLLLREAGIPARYATGYAVMERDMKRKEYVIRGTHGHAWCRVWDASAGKWIDFDTTPGSWFETVAPQNTTLQRFNDMLRRMREDFFLWRNRPNNRLAVSLVMSAIALGVITFIVSRLWKSKRRMEAERRSNGYGGAAVRTPLNAIEAHAEKRLGPRPPGQPFAAWLVRLRPTLPDGHPLDEAIALHQRQRFDPAPPLQEEQERLAELARQLESAIKRGSV